MKLPKELTTVTPLSKTVGLIMLISLPIIAFLWGMRYQQLINSQNTPPMPLLTKVGISPTIMVNNKVYENKEYGFAFDLKENERVVACPNKNEYNDNIIVWTTKESLTNDDLECSRGMAEVPISASKKSGGTVTNNHSVQEYLAQLQSKDYNYNVNTTPITISGRQGIKIVGTRDKSHAAPLPDEINEAVFFHDNILYIVNNTYLQHNFRFVTEQ